MEAILDSGIPALPGCGASAGEGVNLSCCFLGIVSKSPACAPFCGGEGTCAQLISLVGIERCETFTLAPIDLMCVLKEIAVASMVTHHKSEVGLLEFTQRREIT
jgi:hypothetical protein